MKHGQTFDKVKLSTPIVVRVTELTCAPAGRAAEAFDFPLPDVPVRFDRSRNRYEFDFATSLVSEKSAPPLCKISRRCFV